MLQYYTIEYDGYVYKKPEKKEEKEGRTGLKYLLEELHIPNEDREALVHIVAQINKRTKWKDLSEKQARVYSRMEKILNRLRTYTPFSAPFLNKVNKREAPEYYTLIEHPMDLSKIGKKLSAQEYPDVQDFANDLDLIWSNCFKFNCTYGNIYSMYAQKMKERAFFLLQDLYTEKEIEVNEPLEVLKHLWATEKKRKELVASRLAILQQPTEFVCKRTPGQMLEYYVTESAVAQEIEHYRLEKERSLQDIHRKSSSSHLDYLPEWTYFYNSFPYASTDAEDIFLEECSLEQIDTISELLHAQRRQADTERPGKSSRLSATQEGSRPSAAQESSMSHRGSGRLPFFYLGSQDAYGILRHALAQYLLSLGITQSESAAFEVLLSYVLFEIRRVLSELKALKSTESFEEIAYDLLAKYKVQPVDFEPVTFFSENEEHSSSDSILDLICSDVDGLEELESIM